MLTFYEKKSDERISCYGRDMSDHTELKSNADGSGRDIF